MGDLKVPEIALLGFLLRSHRPNFEYLDQCEWSESDMPEPYPADRNHKEFKVDVEAYIPDPQKFEIRGSPRYPRPICNNLVAKLKIKSPGLILLPGQQLVLKMHRYVLVNPKHRDLAVFISIDEFHWLDLEYSYRRRLQTGGLLEMNEAMRNIISNPHDLTTFDPPNYSVQGSVYTGGIQTADWVGDFMDSPSLFMTELLNIFYAGAHASDPASLLSHHACPTRSGQTGSGLDGHDEGGLAAGWTRSGWIGWRLAGDDLDRLALDRLKTIEAGWLLAGWTQSGNIGWLLAGQNPDGLVFGWFDAIWMEWFLAG
ncbi:hypothetical protein BDD12DRAFT_894590 [Trichophaea hybrida]|nr:hypothetical protein BDD12DRAFT_894590 [Trichophaea hybrida]